MDEKLLDLLTAAAIGALEDGELSVEDFPEWKKFKKRARRELRGLLRDLEDGAVIEVDSELALLLLGLLAALRRS